MGFTLGDLADKIRGELRGDPDCQITSVASLRQAGKGAVSFLANPHYRQYLRTTRASAVILTPADVNACPTATIAVADPYAAFARAAALIVPPAPPQQGVHPTAVIGEACRIDVNVGIGPNCVIEDSVTIAAGVRLAGGCYVGKDSSIGPDTVIHANVTICPGVRIGARAVIHSGAVIGSDGFGMAKEGGHWLKVPQLGGVVIGDDVEIGANTTIDRGTLEDTVLEDGVKLDNLVQVAHNVFIGAHTAIAGCVGISGSTSIGRHCMIGGGVGIVGHLAIADDVIITGMTMVTRSIPRAGVYSSGVPAQANTAWNRNYARIRQLDKLAKKLHALGRKLNEKN